MPLLRIARILGLALAFVVFSSSPLVASTSLTRAGNHSHSASRVDPKHQSQHQDVGQLADLDEVDVTQIDFFLPDHWNKIGLVDPRHRIATNGDGGAPEQLVKVTDKRHRFPMFATICSIGFLLTIITIIVICTA